MRLFTGPERPAIAGIATTALAWRPIETFDHISRPLAFLRSPDRLIAGTWGRPSRQDDAAQSAPIAPLQWVEIIDGDFIPLPRFQPTEWVPISDSLFEPAEAFSAAPVARAEHAHR